MQHKLPHWQESFKIINGAFERIQQKYKNVECRSETNMFLHEMKQKLHELLDAGCETIILTSPMAIYSHFEEFNSGFRHCFEYIEEWEHKPSRQKNKSHHRPANG